MRMRPVSPEELDMVDWRGRWINDDEEYDDEEEEEDRQMEDFDPVSALDGDNSGRFLMHFFRMLVTAKTMMMKRRRKRRREVVPLGFQQTKPR